jgi:hypothetical protein
VLVVNSTNRRNDTVISIDEVRKPWQVKKDGVTKEITFDCYWKNKECCSEWTKFAFCIRYNTHAFFEFYVTKVNEARTVLLSFSF